MNSNYKVHLLNYHYLGLNLSVLKFEIHPCWGQKKKKNVEKFKMHY